MNNWFYALVSVIVVSLISLVGIFTLLLNSKFLSKILLFLVSFSVGALFGDAFIHLIPQAFKDFETKTTSLFVLAGILLFFVLEKFLRWRHCHISTSEDHPHHLAVMNLVGDGVHNLIDGLIISASFSVGLTLGLTTTLAIVLHEIPQEIGNFGVLVYSGMSRQKALLLNFVTALTAIAGAGLFIIFGAFFQNLNNLFIPLAAGGFLYIAGSDLIPELHHETKPLNSLLQFIAIILGISVMFLLLFLEV